jgi:uracil-DNA glycosylase family 4
LTGFFILRQCGDGYKVCEKQLALGARPVVTGSVNSRIVIIGQAPGLAVHNTGIPWNDKSGENLRAWMNVSREDFYDVNKFAIIPMGFCYPGRGKSGDLPPRKECAPLWHKKLFDNMPDVKLILLIGKYAQNYYLKNRAKSSLTDTVKNYKEYLPEYFVLPHPSPLNNIWQKRNEWFKQEVIPDIKDIIRTIID